MNLTKDEKESVVTELVGKLLTRRPFNKEAMLGTFRVVWKISKDVEVSTLDSNLFLFKFAIVKDRESS